MNISASTSAVSTSALQKLKAQQAWEMRQVGRTPLAPEIGPAAPAEKTALPEVAFPGGKPTSQWGDTVDEIQTIARRSGFVGLSERDIRQAYTYGESLLADYRV